jgi:hypothetical protein
MDALQIDQLQEVIGRIKKTEEIVQEGQKEETARIAKKVEFLEETLTTDFYTFKNQVDSELESTKITAMKAFMEVSKGSLSSGMKLINDCIRMIIHDSMRKRFIQWRNYDPVGVLARGRELIALTKRAHRKMFLRDAMYEWKTLHEKQKKREVTMHSNEVNVPALSAIQPAAYLYHTLFYVID